MSKSYYAVLSPEQANSKLAVQDGKIVVHLPNYLKLFEELPVVSDDRKQVFRVIPSADLVQVVDEGQGPHPHLWNGDRSRRDQPLNLCTVEILPLGSAAAPTASEVETARAALADLPLAVQVAAALSLDDAAPALVAGKSVEELKAWVDATLTGHAAAAKAG